MSNSNVITGYVGGTKRSQIPTQTLAATTETAFLINTDTGTTTAIVKIPSGTGVGGSSTPLDTNNTNSAFLSNGPRQYGPPGGTSHPHYNSTSFVGRAFKVRLTGTGTAAANAGNTLALTLYVGTTIAGTAIGGTGLTNTIATASAASLNFIIEATLIWDPTTGSITGSQWYNVNYNGTQPTHAFQAPAALLAIPTAAAVANLSFVASAKWGNAVGGTISITEFVLEEI